MLRPTSAMLYSTTTSIMIAGRHQSGYPCATIATLLLELRASALARLVEIVVLPMPPLAPKTVRTVPRAALEAVLPTGSGPTPFLLLQDAVNGPRELFRARRLD